MVLSVATMNLITAILVDTAIANSALDAEVEKQALRKLRPEISKAFRSIDINGDGKLCKTEILSSASKLPKQFNKAVDQESLSDIFDLLDMDNSGKITEAEFSEGIFRLVFADISFETLQQMRMLRSIKDMQSCIQSDLQKVCSKLNLGNCKMRSPSIL